MTFLNELVATFGWAKLIIFAGILALLIYSIMKGGSGKGKGSGSSSGSSTPTPPPAA